MKERKLNQEQVYIEKNTFVRKYYGQYLIAKEIVHEKEQFLIIKTKNDSFCTVIRAGNLTKLKNLLKESLKEIVDNLIINDKLSILPVGGNMLNNVPKIIEECLKEKMLDGEKFKFCKSIFDEWNVKGTLKKLYNNYSSSITCIVETAMFIPEEKHAYLYSYTFNPYSCLEGDKNYMLALYKKHKKNGVSITATEHRQLDFKILRNN